MQQNVTVANQTAMRAHKYDAFGNIISETGPAFKRGFTYTSRERHYRSGFYYYRARFYDPQTGRFITQDPIGHIGGVNLYAYVGNSPVSFYDPHGLCLERAMDWVLNDFVVPGPYGSPNPEDWGEWVSLPYEAGKFGKGYETAVWTSLAIATAADLIAGGAIAVEYFGTETIVTTRGTLGATDSATSQIIKTASKISKRTIKVIHKVTKDGKIIHMDTKFQRFWPF